MTRRSIVPFEVNLAGLITLVVLIGVWQGAADTGLLRLRYFPTPLAIARQSGFLIHSTNLGGNLLHTLAITLLGWALASLAGVAVGLLLGLSPIMWRWSMASVDVLRALPAIAFLPVAVLLVGISSRLEVVIVVYAAFWPVVVNTIDGVRHVSPVTRDVARTLRLHRRQVVAKVVLPSAAEPIIIGLRLALTLSLVLAVVAEMLVNPIGLGHQLVFEQQALRPELMFGYLIVIGLVAIVLNSGFQWALRLVAPGVARVTERQQ